MSDVMSVRLHLSGVRVRRVLVDAVDRLEVEVESTRGWSRCPHCGFPCPKVWDRRAKRIRDLEVSGRRTTLVWRRRRFCCGNCGERHLEDHTQFQGGLTRRFAHRLVQDARVMSIRAASRHHGVGWHRIMRLVSAEAARVAERRRARLCRVLLVDETSIRRRHRYVTVVACGESGKVLAMRDQGAWWCRQVEIVVSDGSRSYQAGIGQYLPDARHVLDRFHVARWFTQGLTLVRRELQRRPPDQRPPTYEPDLFRARFTLLRRADHLTDSHQAHLDRLFEAYPRLRTAWDALFKSSTSSMKPKTSMRPTRRWDGSLISTTAARFPNTARSWTPSSHGEKRYSPTTAADGSPTDPSKGSTTYSRSYDESLTGSRTMTITQTGESS